VRRLVTCLLAPLALVAAAFPSQAAPPRPYLSDVTGDANGVNSQKVSLPLPQTSTAPASVGRADIVSVTLSTLYRGSGRSKRANGLQITMRLAEAPADGVTYEWSTDWRGTCDGLRSTLSGYLLIAREVTTGSATCTSADGSSSNDVLLDVQVDPVARTVTWRTRPTMPRGARVESMTASTSVFVAGVYDEAWAAGAWSYGR